MKLNKVALLFPGQGSQLVGMGKELAGAFHEASECFQELDDALEQNLSDLMFSGPAEALMQTHNTQPAIMAVSIAVWRILQKHLAREDVSQVIAAGHSVGEYGALCASGALSFADTANLLRTRGEAMQKAVPAGHGGMVALVGCNIDQVENVVAAAKKFGICEIANDNGADQIVVSGTTEAMKKVEEIATEFGVRRAIRLGVSAPFHSSLMSPATKIMERELSRQVFSEMRFPVFSNYEARLNRDEGKIASLLTKQIEGRVRWREIMNSLIHAEKRSLYIEIGSGNVLSNIARRMNKDITVLSMHTPGEIESVMKHLDDLAE